MFFQYDNKSIDPFSNPYFKLKAYICDSEETYSAREANDAEIKLIKCPNSELKKFFGNHSTYHSGKTACFANPDQLKIQSNWWLPGKFKSLVVALEKC